MYYIRCLLLCCYYPVSYYMAVIVCLRPLITCINSGILWAHHSIIRNKREVTFQMFVWFKTSSLRGQHYTFTMDVFYKNLRPRDLFLSIYTGHINQLYMCSKMFIKNSEKWKVSHLKMNICNFIHEPGNFPKVSQILGCLDSYKKQSCSVSINQKIKKLIEIPEY